MMTNAARQIYLSIVSTTSARLLSPVKLDQIVEELTFVMKMCKFVAHAALIQSIHVQLAHRANQETSIQ
jgi:hypothetical protein